MYNPTPSDILCILICIYKPYIKTFIYIYNVYNKQCYP